MKDKNNKKQQSFTLDAKVVEAINKGADKEGRSKSNFLNNILSKIFKLEDK